jgi:hypothetical protein
LYPKKHITRWFTTSNLRAINLDLVTDVRIVKREGILTHAIIYLTGHDRMGEGAISIDADDAHKLLDRLY